MKILLVTPLFPPDIADPAPYVKELASRLSKDHEVTVLTYSHLPEKLAQTKIITIEKSRMLPLRLLSMLAALRKEAKNNDVVYVQNGPSTELPTALIALFSRTPFLLRLGDEAALRFAEKSRGLRFIQRFTIKRMNANIVHDSDILTRIVQICRANCAFMTDRPLTRPEILPFEKYPKDDFIDYKSSWDNHIQFLTERFDHARN